MDISVIVCTFDRPELLERMLASCECASRSAARDWELLLVDNGERPGATEVAARFAGRLPLRVLSEPEQGKSRALNRGIGAARGSLLLFTDDDVELRTGWIKAFEDAARRAPKAGWFGGRSIPKWGEGTPAWIRREVPQGLRGYCCLYDLGDSARFYTEGDLLPIGACMAVRAATFTAIGGYNLGLGPQGTDRGVGDDTELLTRAMRQEIPGYWVPEAVVDHWVPAERLRVEAIFRYGRIKGTQQAEMAGRRRGAPGASLRLAGQLARGVIQQLRGRPGNARVCVLNAGLAWGAARRAPRSRG